MQVLLIVLIMFAAAVAGYLILELTYQMMRRHRGATLHTLTDREVADNSRPHGAHITVAPVRDPRDTTHNPVN